MTARRVVALGGGDPSGVTALGLEELVRAGVADIRTTGVLAAWRAELAAFLERYPAVDDYDSEGNYIGTVRNENGWTP